VALLSAVRRKPCAKGYCLKNLLKMWRSQRTMSVKDKFSRYLAADVVGSYWFTYVADHQAWYAVVKSLFGSLKNLK
jgi:hypothetical protein